MAWCLVSSRVVRSYQWARMVTSTAALSVDDDPSATRLDSTRLDSLHTPLCRGTRANTANVMCGFYSRVLFSSRFASDGLWHGGFLLSFALRSFCMKVAPVAVGTSVGTSDATQQHTTNEPRRKASLRDIYTTRTINLASRKIIAYFADCRR